jgi:hypoxanthine phosphoribosyltransferase
MSSGERIEYLARLYAAHVQREPTREEERGIADAVVAAGRGGMTAAVALGYLAGTNGDWPDTHIDAALRAYGLGAAHTRKEGRTP